MLRFIKHISIKALLFIIIFVMGTIKTVYSQQFPDPATLSTGQGAPNTLDPLWVVSPWYSNLPPNPIGLSYNPALINNNCAPGSWVDPTTLPPPVNNGNWITGSESPCATNTNDGYRYFRLAINLPPDCNGYSISTQGVYTLSLSGYVDNTITDVYVNGTSTGISGGGFSNGSQLNITLTGPWVSGINYIDILIYNFPAGGGSNPYGLLLVANTNTDSDNDGVSDVNDNCPCTQGSFATGCPASITGDTIICKGESTTLTSTGVGTYLWSNGSTSSSITVNPTVTTAYAVVVTTSNGFKDTSIVNVTVNQPPSIELSGRTVICNGETTTLKVTGNGVYNWSTNSTADSIRVSPTTTTSYTVVTTNSNNNCKDSIVQDVIVRAKPAANFGSDNVCLGAPTPFTDSSSTAGGTLNIWKWNFGDASPDNLTQNPSHQYTTAGNHSVTLITQNTFGCADTITKNVTVYFNPVANFTASDVCFGDSVLFFDSSYVDISASVAHYLWVFNDGSPTDTSKNPHHYYAAHGSYNVTLLASTNQNCSTAVTKTVKVFDAPNAAFSVADVCWNTNAVFVNSSTPPTMGTIGSQQWNFGDGSAIDVSTNPQHLYVATGNYAVTLITRSSNLACADTVTDSVTVFPLPNAAFSAPQVCLGQAMSFNDFSNVAAPSTVVSWNWNYGDGTAVSTLQNPNHTYSNFGSYTVTLIVTTNNTACKDTISDSVIVHPVPHPAFTTSNVCEGSVAQFNDMSTIPSNITNDGILAWTWDFGNSSSTSNNQNASQQYTLVGVDTVELKVVSNFGCVDSVTKPIVINPNPVVNFTVSDTAGCEPFCILFNDASTILTGSNVTWKWVLGDNTSSTDTSFTHCYYNDLEFDPVHYSITLKVTSDSGCSTVLTRDNYITVYPEPVASFHTEPVSTSIANPVFDIKEHSIGANFWYWNFGDGDTSNVQHPQSHTYADTGHYNIRLVVNTNYNCTDTSYRTVIVEPDYILYIPNAFTPNDDGVNDVFIPQGIFFNEFEMSIFDRWGNLVYKTDDVTKPWDGKHKTGIAQNDVYVYVIRIKDFKLQKHIYRGQVSLIR